MQRSISQPQGSTPHSVKTSKKGLHLRKLLNMNIDFPTEHCEAFVLGICGGDCAGKRQMIQYMFDRRQDGWVIKGSEEPVAIVHQSYFVSAADGSKYSSGGTDWKSFCRQVLNLLIGNEVQLIHQGQKVVIKPAKLLVVEGSHIFMSSEVTNHLSSLINLKVFIDSDSDVRLSRRVYQDTQELHKDLSESVANYLEFIKPSYERDIEPTKQTSDIIIPHFGGGFNDHKKSNRLQYDSNIKNACNLILTHLKEEMKKYEEECIEDP